MLGDRGANPVLDDVGAGIFGALTRLVIDDIMRGTRRSNLAQGAVATAQGIWRVIERQKFERSRIQAAEGLHSLSRTWRSQAIPGLWSAWGSHNLRDVNRRFFGSI